jgi:hypothetical protein
MSSSRVSSIYNDSSGLTHKGQGGFKQPFYFGAKLSQVAKCKWGLQKALEERVGLHLVFSQPANE